MNSQKPLSAQQEKQRQFLLVLPVLVLPFITFLLWSIGLVGSTQTKAQEAAVLHGLNAHLPDARLKEDQHWNKLSFYEQADKDSAKYKEQLKNDPYYSFKKLDTNPANSHSLYSHPGLDYDPSPRSNHTYTDANEEKVNQKLAELNKALNQSATASQAGTLNYKTPAKPMITSVNTPDVNRLETMLTSMNQKDTGSDPEMQQLSGMMDKILDIQHPERVKERIKGPSEQHTQVVFPVTMHHNSDTVSLLQAVHENSNAPDTAIQKKDNVQEVIAPSNAFYSLDNTGSIDEKQNAIPAVVQETQTIVSGAPVKLRLTGDVYINGILIHKDNFIYGMASLNGERLNISIHTIRYQHNILPVALSVYDMDGLSGIYIPGAITREVAKQSADEATQSIGLTTMDPSIAAQAASAGIQAAKTLVSKKIKLVKVTVKAGYQVLLRDNNQKQ